MSPSEHAPPPPPPPAMRLTTCFPSLARQVGGDEEVAATPPQPNIAMPTWEGVTLPIRLPSGSPRPPLISVQLWDEQREAQEALASADVRLDDAAQGEISEMTLTGRIGFKDVRVSFAWAVAEEAA